MAKDLILSVFQVPPSIKDYYQHPCELLSPPVLDTGVGVSDDIIDRDCPSETSLEEQEHVSVTSKTGY